jgi:uncharacterized protein YbaR (Trm112 family)
MITATATTTTHVRKKEVQQAIEMDIDSCPLCGGFGELNIYSDSTTDTPDTLYCWECKSTFSNKEQPEVATDEEITEALNEIIAELKEQYGTEWWKHTSDTTTDGEN